VGDGVCPNILAELCSQILALPGIRPDSFSVKLTRPTVTVGSQFEQFVSSAEEDDPDDHCQPMDDDPL
jgi:hypothetical protein